MGWLYIFDLVFWYLQKGCLLVVISWFAWQWWREYQVRKRRGSEQPKS
jgi:predicted negative regulator of RcsB-dependent stress response